MRLGEAVRTGYLEISCHKMRSFLSFSAVAFGVAAILYTFSEVHEMYHKQAVAVAMSGPGRMEIRLDRSELKHTKRGLSKGLTYSDAEAIRRALPELYMVSPTLEINPEFRSGDLTIGIGGAAVGVEFSKRDWAYTLRGRLFNEEDIRSASKVCIIVEPGGWSDEKHKPFWAQWWKDDEYDTFVKRNDLLGQTVLLNSKAFTVIGVLKNPFKDKDPRWFMRNYSQVFLPMTTGQRYLADGDGKSKSPDVITTIQVDTGSEATLPYAKRRLEVLLDGLHRGERDYKIEDFHEIVRGQLEQMRNSAIAILSVGLIAILAGGVGIMNVTLATIFSRVREIGIRRAIGATRGDIMVQFITEAVMLGLLGGAAGILLGTAGVRFLGRDGPDKIHNLMWWHFLATLAIAGAAGFVFSLYPAHQASKLDPIEALRYE